MSGLKTADPRRIDKLLKVLGIASYSVAVFIIVWSLICRVGVFEEKYRAYTIWLSNLEIKIASINNLWVLVICILLMYFIKTVYPLYPISILSMATAMVFDVPHAIAINSAGMIILFSVRYMTGVWSGGGNLGKLINKNVWIQSFVSGSDGKGSAWLLLACRLVPGMTISNVSMLYGSMGFPFVQFMLISYSGYLPKMLFYVVIGSNVSNPFSLSFSIPTMIMFLLTGTSLFGIRWVFDTFIKEKESTDSAAPVRGAAAQTSDNT